MQRFQIVESDFKIVVGNHYILDAADFQAGLREHVDVILLILTQTVEGVEQAVGNHVFLTHTRIEIHNLKRIVFVTAVGCVFRQVYLKHMGVVGNRQNNEIFPVVCSRIQLDGRLRHINRAVILVSEIGERG